MSIWSKYSFDETVPKELEAKLPQASPNWQIRFSWMWVRQLWKWIRRHRNSFGYIAPCPNFYFTSRGANFRTTYVGPFSITIKQPWLLMSAKALHPIIVKEHNDNS